MNAEYFQRSWLVILAQVVAAVWFVRVPTAANDTIPVISIRARDYATVIPFYINHPGLSYTNSGLPELIIRVDPPELAPDIKLRLRLPPASGLLRILDTHGRVLVQGDYERTSTFFIPPDYYEDGSAVFHVVSRESRSEGVDLRYLTPLIYLDGAYNGQLLPSAVEILSVAQMFLPWEGLSPEKIYVSDEHFPVDTPLEPLIERIKLRSRWIQDEIEFAQTMHGPDPGGIVDLVADLGRSNADPVLVGSSFPPQQTIRYVNWRNIRGDGGDIMVSPPLEGYPFGRMIVGNRIAPTLRSPAMQLLLGQRVHGEPIVIDTSWLSVGHVDELFSFPARDRLLIPCPYFASSLLHERIVAGGDDRIRTGSGSFVKSERSALDVVVDKTLDGELKLHTLETPLPAQHDPETAESNWLMVPYHRFQVYDYVRLGPEIAMVAQVESHGGGSRNMLRLQRGEEYRTERPAHPPGTRIYAYTAAMTLNLIDPPHANPLLGAKSARTMILAELDRLTATLRETDPWPSLLIVALPVLFELHPASALWRPKTPNLVNCIPLAEHGVFMPHPHNDYWAAEVEAIMKKNGLTAHFLPQPEIWDEYHRRGGSIHCGSAVRRKIDFPPAWQTRQLQSSLE